MVQCCLWPAIGMSQPPAPLPAALQPYQPSDSYSTLSALDCDRAVVTSHIRPAALLLHLRTLFHAADQPVSHSYVPPELLNIIAQLAVDDAPHPLFPHWPGPPHVLFRVRSHHPRQQE